jgi:hypothetical protein
MLLFADDIALFTTSPDSLQTQLNMVQDILQSGVIRLMLKRQKIVFLRKENNRVIMFGQ